MKKVLAELSEEKPDQLYFRDCLENCRKHLRAGEVVPDLLKGSKKKSIW